MTEGVALGDGGGGPYFARTTSISAVNDWPVVNPTSMVVPLGSLLQMVKISVGDTTSNEVGLTPPIDTEKTVQLLPEKPLP